MALRSSYRPLRPDLDNFLFAAIGEEQNGIPLSMVSALTRLGLDPWDEAQRLASLGKREAVEQLARLLAELPDAGRPLAEAREIAGGLVDQLPKRDSNRPPPPQIPARRPPRWGWPKAWPTGWLSVPRRSQIWVFCLVVAAAALFSMFLQGGFPFGAGGP